MTYISDIPILTRRDAELLRDCPYVDPLRISDTPRRRIARTLVAKGLLEEHPDQNRLYRCTEAGTLVVELLKRRGWL